jgi:hypothetical protein
MTGGACALDAIFFRIDDHHPLTGREPKFAVCFQATGRLPFGDGDFRSPHAIRRVVFDRSHSLFSAFGDSIEFLPFDPEDAVGRARPKVAFAVA